MVTVVSGETYNANYAFNGFDKIIWRVYAGYREIIMISSGQHIQIPYGVVYMVIN